MVESLDVRHHVGDFLLDLLLFVLPFLPCGHLEGCFGFQLLELAYVLFDLLVVGVGGHIFHFD